MTTPIPWTQENINTLVASIAGGGGAVTLQFGDRSVTFASLKERLALLAEMQRVVNPGASPAYRLAAVSRGT